MRRKRSAEASSGTEGNSKLARMEAPADTAADAAASPSSSHAAASLSPSMVQEDIGLRESVAAVMPWLLKAAAALVALNWSPLQSTLDQLAVEASCPSNRLLVEFVRFLLVKCATCDRFGEKVSPPPVLDRLWQSAIIDTFFYQRVQSALRMKLHRSPLGSSSSAGPVEKQQPKQRRTLMRNFYRGLFACEPIGERRSLPAMPVATVVASSAQAAAVAVPLFAQVLSETPEAEELVQPTHFSQKLEQERNSNTSVGLTRQALEG